MRRRVPRGKRSLKESGVSVVKKMAAREKNSNLSARPPRLQRAGEFAQARIRPRLPVQYGAVKNASPLLLIVSLELLLALLGASWMLLAKYPFLRQADPWRDTVYFLGGYLALLGLERAAETLAPSAFMQLDSLMRSVIAALREAGVSYNATLLLAAVSALGEEFWFRGAIQNFFAHAFSPSFGLASQALLFALAHPAPGKSGRLYMAWAFLAGLIFGALYLLSGSLIPGMLVHFLYNAKAFSEAYEEPGPQSRR